MDKFSFGSIAGANDFEKSTKMDFSIFAI